MTTEKTIVKTIAELARAQGVSRPTIYTWKKKGMPVEPDGSFDLEKITAWRATWDVEDLPVVQMAGGSAEGGPDDCETMAFWETRFRRARALNQELDLKVKKKRLIPAEEVDDMLIQRAREFKRELLDRGRRLALRCSNKDSKQIAEILEADTIAILEKYSRD